MSKLSRTSFAVLKNSLLDHNRTENINHLVEYFPNTRVYDGFAGRIAKVNILANYKLGYGHSGCTLSHYMVWDDFLYSGNDWLLLCESDAIPKIPFNELMASFTQEADVYYLFGSDASWYTHRKHEPKSYVDKNWYRLPNPVCLCSVMYSRKFLVGFDRRVTQVIDRQLTTFYRKYKINVLCGDFFEHGIFGSNTTIDSGR